MFKVMKVLNIIATFKNKNDAMSFYKLQYCIGEKPTGVFNTHGNMIYNFDQLKKDHPNLVHVLNL